MVLIKSVLLLIAITLIPTLELRASIPYGIFMMVDTITWPVIVVICIIANIILGWIVFWIMGPVFEVLRKWKWFDRNIWPILDKTRHKIHPYVEKYGELGVAVFIGIPLPMSGVYTGALGAYLLGVDKRKFAIANVIGVLIAAAAVTMLCLLILYGVVADDSFIGKLFLKK